MNELDKNGWQFPIRTVAFWVLFFGLFRAFFIKMNCPADGAKDAWQSLRAALPLDASMAAWATAIPVVLWAAALFFPKIGLKNAANWVSRSLIALFSAACLANVLLYKEWSAVINRRAVSYLKTPEALFDSLGRREMVSGLVMFVFALLFFGKIYDWAVAHGGFFGKKGPIWVRAVAVLLVLGMVFLLVRGLGTMPINESRVYFSPNNFSNHAAVNPVWHLFHDFIEERATRNPFVFFEKKQAERMVAELFLPGQSIEGMTSSHPLNIKLGETNIVIIAMESLSARMFDDTVRCPNLNRLARAGASFPDIYGSGFRTDQGIVSILSGYPAQPDQSILMLSDKAEKLPCLPRFFAKNNYSTLFCYGGELTFGNLGVYLRSQNFQKIVSQNDFPAAEITQKWGADDTNMFSRFVVELDGLRPPFFATALTLSLHTPFDLPGDNEIGGMGRADKFRRAAEFSDRALGDFFEKIREKSWFENTIFIITADHGHGLPDETPLEMGASRRVPLIFYGEKLPPGIPRNLLEQTGCQHDLPASVLSLFGAQHVDYQWSRDIFREQKTPFAYWSNEVALGWKDREGEHIFDFVQKKWTTGSPSASAQAYLQVLYGDFLAK